MYSGGCFSSICVGGCVFPAFVIQNLWVCSVVSLQEMYSGGCFSSICVGGCVFPAFVIQKLSSLPARNVQRKLLQQYWCGGCVFPAFVFQNLWVCSVVSLQEMYSVGCLQQYMCVWLCFLLCFRICGCAE